MKHGKTVYILFIVVQCLIYGVGNPLSKYAYDAGLSTLWCLAVRFAIAAVIFFLISGRRALAELRRSPVKSWLLPSLFLGAGYIFCNLSLKLTAATMAGFLMGLPVLFVPILAVPILHRRYRPAFLPVHIAAVIGLYLLCCGGAGGGFSFGWGEVTGLLGAMLVAASLLWSERGLKELSPVTISMTQCAAAAVLSLAAALCVSPGIVWREVTPVGWITILYLALLCSCLAYWLQNTALRRITAGLVSLTQCAEPVFTAVFSFWFLHERLNVFGWLGAVLLLLCIVYGNRIGLRSPGGGSQKGLLPK